MVRMNFTIQETAIVVEALVTGKERDLEVRITETLSRSHNSSHCQNCRRMKANQLVGMIRRTYEAKSKNNIVPLYKSLVGCI